MSDYFPIVLAIVLIFSGLLDTATTAYILRTNPELFHANEGGLLAKHFKDTQFFWIGTLGYAIYDSILLLIGYFSTPKNNVFVKMLDKFGFDKETDSQLIYGASFTIRLQCMIVASSGIICAINWMKYIY